MTAKKTKSNIDKVQDVTSGTPIRFEAATSKRKRKSRATVLVTAPEEFAGGFIDFLRDNAVVGVAIGFVIGLQAQALMKQLISSFIDPAFTLFFGQALSQRSFTLTLHGRSATFTWGAFMYALVGFIFVLAAIYIIYKVFRLNKLDKPKEDK